MTKLGKLHQKNLSSSAVIGGCANVSDDQGAAGDRKLGRPRETPERGGREREAQQHHVGSALQHVQDGDVFEFLSKELGADVDDALPRLTDVERQGGAAEDATA
jgi:hypothetical protein